MVLLFTSYRYSSLKAHLVFHQYLYNNGEYLPGLKAVIDHYLSHSGEWLLFYFTRKLNNSLPGQKITVSDKKEKTNRRNIQIEHI